MAERSGGSTRPRVSMVLHKFSRGGSDRVAAYLANGFKAAGIDVELAVMCRGGEIEDHLVGLVDDIPIHYLGIASRSRAWDIVRTLPALVRHLKARRPDAVLSTANNTALASAIALILSGLNGARLLLKTTNPIATSRHVGIAKSFRRWTYRLIFRRTAAVWTLSADETEEMRSAFPAFRSLFREVYNPYVTPAMLLEHEERREGRGRRIVSVARLTRQKRLDRLIAAFAHVKGPDTRLLILGEGEDRAQLTAQAEQLNCAGRIDMPGYVPDVADALHSANLFVLTSDYEGLPAAVLEAMAANCPVLCTDCFPAARSLLAAADGCAIIESTAPDDLAAQIEASLRQPRPANLPAIAEQYSIANGVQSHIQALTEVIPAFRGASSI